MSRETIIERQAHGVRPRSVSVTVTTDELGRMTIEATGPGSTSRSTG